MCINEHALLHAAAFVYIYCIGAASLVMGGGGGGGGREEH